MGFLDFFGISLSDKKKEIPKSIVKPEIDDGSFDMTMTGFSLEEIEELVNWTPEMNSNDSEDVGDKKKIKCPKCGYKF